MIDVTDCTAIRSFNSLGKRLYTVFDDTGWGRRVFFNRIFLVSTPLLNVFYNSVPCLKLTAAKKSMRIAFKGFYGSKST